MLTEVRASTAQLGYWSGEGNIRFMNVCMNSGNLFSTMLCLTERIRVSCEDKHLSYIVRYLSNALFNSTLPVSKTKVCSLALLNQTLLHIQNFIYFAHLSNLFQTTLKNQNLNELILLAAVF